MNLGRNHFGRRVGLGVGLSALLALAANVAGAQTLPDQDGDGVVDPLDNCLAVANGPSDSSNQVDTDGDGYGNACDADYDQDGLGQVNVLDFSVFLPAFTGASPNAATDHDGDAATTGVDFAVFLAQFQSGSPQIGPSGLECADPSIVDPSDRCEVHDDDGGGATVSEQEAFEIDVALVAEGKGLPVQDVRSSISFQLEFIRFAKDLTQQNPDQVSRMWLEPVPASAGVIEFVGDAPVVGTPPGITLQSGGMISASDHDRRAEVAAEALQAANIASFHTYFDARENRIVIELFGDDLQLLDSPIVFDLVRSHLAQSPALTGVARELLPQDLVVREGQPYELDKSRGGEEMTDGGGFECTSGWSVEGPDGDGIVTAAHCTGLDGIEHRAFPFRHSHSTTWRDQERGRGDSEYHTTGGREVAEFSARDREVRDVLSKKLTRYIVPGQSVCRYGRASDIRDCTHEVIAKNVTTTFTDGVTVSDLVRADGDSAIGGDSGGGWSWNNQAWGVHAGSNGTTSVFTPIGRVERELGVDLMM